MKHEGVCMQRCPSGTFNDSSALCQACHAHCQGCSGGGNWVGEGGCDSCDLVAFENPDDPSEVTRCLPGRSRCDEGFYKISLHEYQEDHPLYKKYVCLLVRLVVCVCFFFVCLYVC